MPHKPLEENTKISAAFNNEFLSDITLKFGKKSFFCHKIILAQASEYFKLLFSSKMKESKEKEIFLNEIQDSDAMEDFLYYCYNYNIEIQKKNAIPLQMLAHQFQVEKLEILASNFIQSNLNEENYCDLLEHSEKYQLKSIYETCLNIILKNFEKVFRLFSTWVILRKFSILSSRKAGDLSDCTIKRTP